MFNNKLNINILISKICYPKYNNTRVYLVGWWGENRLKTCKSFGREKIVDIKNEPYIA